MIEEVEVVEKFKAMLPLFRLLAFPIQFIYGLWEFMAFFAHCDQSFFHGHLI